MNDEMKPIVFQRPGIAERIVARLREYARYIDENAENIVGSIDEPTWVEEDGIRVSFIVTTTGVPVLNVEHGWLVIDDDER